ncbi:hypothetical protein RI367_000243 [Sorochytrium milnesiophthora]
MLAPTERSQSSTASASSAKHGKPADVQDEPLIRQICRLNNIDYNALSDPTTHIGQLEICHFSVPQLPRLSVFRHLRSLTLTALDIDWVGPALADCKLLEQLWVCETQITDISGIEGCQRLTHFYGNKLSSLEGIARLPMLKTLWVFDNELTDSQELHHLATLEDLNIANNFLAALHPTVSKMQSLKSLNLAGNRISKLNSLLALAHIHTLETLCLSDQNYAETPVCRQPNYQTFLIHHLRYLKQLDALTVTDAIRRSVDGIFAQKNTHVTSMKGSVIWRNVALFQRQLSESIFQYELASAQHVSAVHADLVEAELAQEQGSLTPDQAWTCTLETLRQDLAQVQGRLAEVRAAEHCVYQYLDQLAAVETLLNALEYTTSGSLSFEALSEDGFWEIEDVFFDFIRSQKVEPLSVFRARSCESGDTLYENVARIVALDTSVADLEQVLHQQEGSGSAKAIREALSSRQDVTLSVILAECQLDNAEETERYLPAIILFHRNPAKDALIEKLFRTISYRTLGGVNGRLPLAELSSSLLDESDRRQHTSPAWLKDALETRKQAAANFQLQSSVTQLNFSALPLKMSPETLSQLMSLRQLTLTHARLEAVPSGLAGLPSLELLDLSWNAIQTLPTERSMSSVATLRLDGNRLNMGAVFDLTLFAPNVKVLSLRFNGLNISAGMSVLRARLRSLLQLNGSKTGPVQMSPLSADAVVAKATAELELSRAPHQRKLDVSTITQLSLSACGISDPDMLLLSRAEALQELDLSHNYVTDLGALDRLACLASLNVSNNLLTTVRVEAPKLSKLHVGNNFIASLSASGDRAALPQTLRWLDMSGNRLGDIASLAFLSKLTHLWVNDLSSLTTLVNLRDMADLTVLDLEGNTLTEQPLYRLFAIFHLCSLQILDGEAVTDEELQSARDQFLGNLTFELLREKVGQASFNELLTLDLRNCRLRKISCFQAVECPNLQHVNLDNNALVDVSDLSRLRALRFLSLNGNRIETFVFAVGDGPGEGLWEAMPSMWPCLEELHLNNNAVAKISALCLQRLPSLRVLYLNGNKIIKVSKKSFFTRQPMLTLCLSWQVDGLDRSKQLVRLYLDNNQIRAIEANSFSALVHLRELSMKYVSDRVFHQYAIESDNRLKSLTNLSGLIKLKHLHLANNRLANAADLKQIAIATLVNISLRGNVLSRNPAYRLWLICQLPQLQRIDGVDLTQEEREKARIYEEEHSRSAMTLSPAPSQSVLAASNAVPSTKQVLKFTNVKFDGSDLGLGRTSFS